MFSCSSELNILRENFDSNSCERINKRFWINIVIKGKPIACHWNTGSTCSWSSPDHYTKLGLPKCKPLNNKLLKCGGRRLSKNGKCVVDVKFGRFW